VGLRSTQAPGGRDAKHQIRLCTRDPCISHTAHPPLSHPPGVLRPAPTPRGRPPPAHPLHPRPIMSKGPPQAGLSRPFRVALVSSRRSDKSLKAVPSQSGTLDDPQRQSPAQIAIVPRNNHTRTIAGPPQHHVAASLVIDLKTYLPGHITPTSSLPRGPPRRPTPRDPSEPVGISRGQAEYPWPLAAPQALPAPTHPCRLRPSRIVQPCPANGALPCTPIHGILSLQRPFGRAR
jgi:hypothetical protein